MICFWLMIKTQGPVIITDVLIQNFNRAVSINFASKKIQDIGMATNKLDFELEELFAPLTTHNGGIHSPTYREVIARQNKIQESIARKLKDVCQAVDEHAKGFDFLIKAHNHAADCNNKSIGRIEKRLDAMIEWQEEAKEKLISLHGSLIVLQEEIANLKMEMSTLNCGFDSMADDVFEIDAKIYNLKVQVEDK